jgi:hypothetical protein
VPSLVHGSPVVSSGAPPISPMVTKGTAGKDLLCAEVSSLHSPGIMMMDKPRVVSREDVVAFGAFQTRR